MASTAILLWIFLISVSLFTTSPGIGDGDGDTPTVYEVLREYGFPVGLLPKGVTSYELDRSTGKFMVYLNKTCSFTIDGYKLNYKTKVTGVISKQRLKDLSGVQVQVLFLWLNIGEVTLDGDELDFSVGIISAGFPVDNLDESPQCGCGFDCANGIWEGIFDSKFNGKRLVYSSLLALVSLSAF
ncbi:hypothetical protein ACH5RR_010809 [Cinchona calisaya]|uniref:Uncharacterized protein n=1 Tax=Cinchona calisaya TaxID=153742 RepID=A0ABD3AJZ5_9GENT